MKKSDPDDYVKNRLKAPKAFFEWCYQSMRTYIWENKSKTIVASNRKHRIVQVQGMRNRVKQPPALKEAVSEWLQIANKTKNKKRQVVAA